jgi:hypothetical protein
MVLWLWHAPAQYKPRGALVPGLLLRGASVNSANAAWPLIARLKRGNGFSAALMMLSMVCWVSSEI